MSPDRTPRHRAATRTTHPTHHRTGTRGASAHSPGEAVAPPQHHTPAPPCASPTASGARGLATGRFFSRDGQLVATVVQEGLLRVGD